MTVTIVLPIFEMFWALPPDIRVVIVMGMLGMIMVGISWKIGFAPHNPLFVGGLIFMLIAVLFFCHFVFLSVLEAAPETWKNATFNLPTLPISIEVR